MQKYKDFNTTTKGRLFLNKELLPRYAFKCPDGSDVLFVGVHKYWDYAPFWNNPAKLCNFYTLDYNEGGGDQPVPDYIMNIEETTLESNRFQQIIMIGVFEYLRNPDKAFKEIHRLLKPGGVAIFAFTGKAEYPDERGMDIKEVFDRLKPLRVIEEYLIYEEKEEPNSVTVVAEKI